MKPPASHTTPSRHTAALVVFAKAPIPGQVKTRLCPPLTPDEAATLHGSFVLDTVERTKAVTERFTRPVDRFLACAPSLAHPFFKVLEARHHVRLIDQIGEDLGERMAGVFDRLFAHGYRSVVLVGTDVPSLPVEEYRRAFALLESHDIALGPALDGGYYLLGLTRPAPALFTDMPWSTGDVRTITEEKARSLELTIALTAPWRDVDTIDDLTALIDANKLDAAKPKPERVFSSRTTGALQLIAERLRARAARQPSSP
ncbi:MAG: TIGR04282 family arsenosugar biosynthesis glycosyltransferase [Nitrospira sp.]|nr:TIGR04282 family arsenosugar biosynthesis glycosyltransferase [Nitrospira sp.]MCP9475090.1 TIGR04282 family arsenosugar biosynthesis glycosyltransferase [Nitrospira sp.]